VLPPVQSSAVSQTPAEPRQVVVESRRALAGHAFDAPVQFSTASQMPAAPRQVTVDAAKASVGHASLAPSQRSATSQTPATAARQTVAVPLFVSPGQLLPTPSQDSVGSQMP